MNYTFTKKRSYKWEVLLLLWMAFLLNQGDRQVFNTVLPAIRDALNLTDTSVGLIATIFNLFYALMVPVGGWAGDRFSRKWVTTISILFWSIATAFTGLATSFLWLVVLRSVATGGGEAFFGPANYSLLGQYHTDTRARAMSIHQTAYYVGVILAGWLAGAIADALGWKYSFIIFGVAGIVWGIIMIFRLHDKEDDTPKPVKSDKPGFFEGFKVVFTTPTALILTIGFSCEIFVITGYAAHEHLAFQMSQICGHVGRATQHGFDAIDFRHRHGCFRGDALHLAMKISIQHHIADNGNAHIFNLLC